MNNPNCRQRPAPVPTADAGSDDTFDFDLDLDFTVPAPPPNSATPALPGSPEKIAILAARARMGEELHHPDDAQLRVAGDRSDEPASLPLAHPVSGCENWFPAMVLLAKRIGEVRYIVPTIKGHRVFWRVRPWYFDSTLGRRRRISLGSFPSEAEAIAALMRWRSETGEGFTFGEGRQEAAVEEVADRDVEDGWATVQDHGDEAEARVEELELVSA